MTEGKVIVQTKITLSAEVGVFTGVLPAMARATSLNSHNYSSSRAQF